MKPIQIKCPGCGKAYQVSNPASVGKQTQCKQCGTKFPIQPVESPEDDEGMVTPVAGGVSAQAAAAQQAPAGPGGDDDGGDDEDYPDNEPTISVSAFEAQKLREQLKQGLMKPQGAPAAAPPAAKPGPRTTVAAAKAPAAAAAAQTGGGNTFVLIALAVVVVSGLAVALFFVMK